VSPIDEPPASSAREPCKRALLIGVTDDHPDQRLQPKPTLLAMQGLLHELGGWTIEVLEGQAANRDGILAGLDRMIAATGPNDTCLIHYFGHGGVVRFDHVDGPLGDRDVFYLSAARSSARWALHGVLDIELSLAFARLDHICANVSVILDCCKSSRTVRGDNVPVLPALDWLPTLSVEAAHDELLDVESHPRIVRLAGTTAYQIAYGRRSSEGDLGLLTSGFVDVVREAKGRLDRLTWDAVVHRVREAAIRARNGGEQWINLAGPRERLVFAREHAELPRAVAFVPGTTPGVGWLRAGALQGVEVGDEWAITELTLDDDLRRRICAKVRVDAIELTRARVIASSPDCRLETLPVGASAHPITAREPSDVFRRIALGELASPMPNSGLSLRWGWFDPSMPGRRITATGNDVRLRVGDRVWFELTHRGNVDWFVSAIELGAHARPQLLNASEPEGMALLPRTTGTLGERAHRHEQGLVLVWPDDVQREQAIPITVLFLACRRPFELGHLVDHAESELARAMLRREPSGSAIRSTGRRAPLDGPEPVHEWTWLAIRYWLDPT
jgi:hypothetical protein